MDQTTPISINEDILGLCKEIDPITVPIFIDVIPTKDSLFSECYGNVDECVKKNGGRIEYGWIIWEIPRVYLEAEFHAVWINSDGEYIDITPKEDKEEKILFLKDNGRKFTGELIDNIRKPLVDNAETRTMVIVGKEKFKINKKYHNKDGPFEIPTFEIAILEAFMRETLLSEINKDKLNGKIKTGRNESCPCGSGKKYKKCCIKD